jgi:hypothetical protein
LIDIDRLHILARLTALQRHGVRLGAIDTAENPANFPFTTAERRHRRFTGTDIEDATKTEAIHA